MRLLPLFTRRPSWSVSCARSTDIVSRVTLTVTARRTTMKNLSSKLAFRVSISLPLLLVALIALLGSGLQRVQSSAQPYKKSSAQLAGPSNPYIRLQDGRKLQSTYSESSAGNDSLQAAGASASLLSNQARPLALASGDIDGDGFPDLVAGYAGPYGGVLTLYRGDPKAFAPEDPAVIEGIAKSQFPDPFMKKATVFNLPQAPDFIATGDFDRDGKQDVLVAARGSNVLQLLAGDKRGGFGSTERIVLPGTITAMMSDDINLRDGLADVVVGINYAGGAGVVVYDSPASILEATPIVLSIPAEARSFAAGNLDDDSASDIAILSGNQVLVLHGWDQLQSNGAMLLDGRVGQLETVALPYGVKAIALGEFIWDRASRTELAVMAEDGAVHIAARGELDTRPFTAAEVLQKRRALARIRDEEEQARKRGEPPTIALASPLSAPLKWEVIDDLSTSVPNSVASGSGDNSSQPLLMGTRISSQPSDDLLMLDGAGRLRLIYREEALQKGVQQPAQRSAIELESEGELVAALPMRLNVMAQPSLVTLESGSVEPVAIIAAPLATFTVDRADDNAGATACTGAANDCSLRGAVIASNSNGTGADIITFNAGINPTLTITSAGGFENAAATGDLDINGSLTITGNGPTTISTTYTSTCGDCKVFGVGQNSTPGLAVSITGCTIQNGFNQLLPAFQGAFFETGGGIDFFLFGTGSVYSMTNCTVNNNQVAASALSHGAGINIDSANTATPGGASAGTVTLTNVNVTNNTSSTFGGGIVLAADKHDVTMTDCSVTGNTATGQDGGGIWIRHSFGGTVNISKTGPGTANVLNNSGTQGGGISIPGNQVVNITNITISNNTATGAGSGVPNGGGISINNLGALNVTGNTTLTGLTISTNHADTEAGAAGGGVYFNAAYPATVSNCTISGNTSISGAGVFHGGSSSTPASALTINSGTSISGNTAAGAGGGFGIVNSVNALATLNGITIDSNTSGSGGDGIDQAGGIINLQGTISVNGGDSINIAGGTFNSTAGTLNLTGNFTRASAGAFNHNSGTVNFTGTFAQAINGTATSETFNTFIVNKSAGALTVGGSTTSITTNDLTMTLGSFTGPATLDINGNTLLSAGTFTAGANITAAGNWTNNGGTFTPGTGLLTFDGGLAQSINGTAASQTFNNVAINKGGASTLNTGGSTVSLITNDFTMTLGTFTAPATLDINGNTLLTAGTLTAGANITAAGNWTNNGGTFTPGTGLVTFDGTTANNLNGTAATQTFNNFAVSKGAGSLTGAASTTTLTLNGAMTLTSGTFAAGTITAINLPGNWTNNGGTFTPGSSNVTFNSTTATQSITGSAASQTFFGITMNKTGQTLNTAGSTTALDLNGNLVLTAGTFTAPATMTIGGNFTQATGTTFTTGSGIVTFDGGGAQSIDGTLPTKTFNNFAVNKGGGTLSGVASTTALDINGNLTITAGTFAAGTATSVTLFGNWTNTGTFTGGSGTVIFDGVGNTQTLSGSTTFNNLTINHTGAGNVDGSGSTLTVTGLLRVQGGTFISSSTFNNVQIDSGQTLQSSAGPINVSGNWTNNGTFSGAGALVFNGTGTQSWTGSGTGLNYGTVQINQSPAGTVAIGASSGPTINTQLTLTSGVLSLGANTLTLNGAVSTTGGTMTGSSVSNITCGGAGANTTLPGVTGGLGTLTINRANGITLGGNLTVNTSLVLTSGDLTTGANTLTMPVGATSGPASGATDVVGAVKRTGGPFAPATTLTFGNPDNQITFGAAGTKPTDLTVTLAKTAPPNPNGYAVAVLRTYTIAKTGGTGFTATLRLHYLDGELNLNDEATLNLRFERASDSHWAAALPSVVDQVNNHVECNAVSDTMLPVRWTMSSLVPTASNGVVTGRIVDNSGNPVEGAVVRLNGTQNRKFITDANGFYRFDNVETNGFYTVTPSRANYSFNPSVRSFSQLGETTEATFGATLLSSGFVNPLDTPEYYVRQHYLDFLGREPDEAGFNFWSDQIIECGADNQCSERRRENVSAAYFFSIEFQQTGGLVDGLYRVGYGVRPEFAAFVPDTRAVGLGVVVGRDGWQAKLEANKQAFVEAFVSRAAFHAAYDGLSSSDYVDALIAHTGVSFSSGEREAWVSSLTTGGTSRADVLRSIAENQRFVAAKFNDAFVMMEYFGYLRRDADADGFQFWLNKLNQFGGNFERAEMVKAFIVSGEYRDRFPR